MICRLGSYKMKETECHYDSLKFAVEGPGQKKEIRRIWHPSDSRPGVSFLLSLLIYGCASGALTPWRKKRTEPEVSK